MKKFITRDVAKILKLTHRTVQLWTDLGIVYPDIQPAKGKGFHRIFSERNLVEFGMVNVLAKRFGVSIKIIQNIFLLLSGAPHPDKVEYNDFYTNPDWGTTKELVFIGDIKGESITPSVISVMTKDGKNHFKNIENILQWFSDNELGVAVTIIMLGRVKNIVIKELGITCVVEGDPSSKRCVQTT